MAKENKRVKIYSALEVANMCGVVNQTTINWIRNGYLKAFSTPGGQYCVYKDDLIAFLSNRGIRLPEELLENKGAEADWNSVIVVDDDVVVNNAVAEFCRKHLDGMSVYQVFDGFDAGAMLMEKKPGFVILDIDLPGIKGQELCQRLKNDVAFGVPYVMIITALEDSSLEQDLLNCGSDCYFKKPLDMKQIVEKIQTSVLQAKK